MFQQPVNYQQPVQNPAYVAAYQQPTPVPVQPVAPVIIAPVIPTAGPQLPATGLPAGWTMDQWNYYGQQYLDTLNNQ